MLSLLEPISRNETGSAITMTSIISGCQPWLRLRKSNWHWKQSRLLTRDCWLSHGYDLRHREVRHPRLHVHKRSRRTNTRRINSKGSVGQPCQSIYHAVFLERSSFAARSSSG